MKAILHIALHDLKLTLQDRSAVFWLFVLPIVFSTFFGLVLGGDQNRAPADGTAHLTVVDLDNSTLSARLLAYLEDERLELMPMSEAERQAAKNPVRTLVIPAGFETKVQSAEQVALRLEKEPGTSEEAALVAQARIVRAATRLIGGLIRTGSAPSAVAGASKQVVTVNARFAGRRTTIPSGFSQSIPGNAAMFVLLVTLTYGAASISGERTLGLLRRMITAPVSRSQIVAGKIIGRFITAAAQIIVLVGVAAFARGAGLIELEGNLVLVLVVLLVYAASVAPLGVAFGAWFKDPDRGASVGVMCTMAMAAFGGCWWPIEVVSKPLQKLALALPTGWAMRGMHGIISFNHPIGQIAAGLMVLAAFGVVFTAVAVKSLRID